MTRDAECESGALTRFALEQDAAAVGFGDVFDDGEADADAFGFAAEFGAKAIKLVEDAVVLGGGNAGAAILDGDVEEVGGGCEAERDGIAGRGVFDRVVEKVDDGLLKGGGVDFGAEVRGVGGLWFARREGCVAFVGCGGSRGRSPSPGGLGFRELEFKGDVVLVGDGADGFESGFAEGAEVGVGEGVGFAVLFDTGEIEDVFNEDGKAAGFLDEEIEIFALFFGVVNAAALEAFGHEAHGGERSAKFVGDAGDEIAFEFVEAFLAAMVAMNLSKANRSDEKGRGEDAAEKPSALALDGVKGKRIGKPGANTESAVGGLGEEGGVWGAGLNRLITSDEGRWDWVVDCAEGDR